MLNLDVNVACINAPFKTGTICGVSTPPEKPSSPSYVRLEAALREHLRSPVELEQQRIADEMNESAQTVHNWRYRSGVSQRGALAAQRLCGASATYILTGEGPKTASGSTEEPDIDISDPIRAVAKLMPYLAPGDQQLVLQRVMALMPTHVGPPGAPPSDGPG